MAAKRVSKSTRRSSRRKPAGVSALTLKYAPAILAPLGKREAAIATRAALEHVLRDSTIRRERVRVYGPFLRIEKPQRQGGAPARVIWVRLRDRDTGIGHEVSVERDKVVAYAKDAASNPPFSDEERQEARALIAGDAKLGTLLARKDVDIEWFNPHAHEGGRLIAARLVRVKERRVVDRLGEAHVDLDAGVLRREADHGELG